MDSRRARPAPTHVTQIRRSAIGLLIRTGAVGSEASLCTLLLFPLRGTRKQNNEIYQLLYYAVVFAKRCILSDHQELSVSSPGCFLVQHGCSCVARNPGTVTGSTQDKHTLHDYEQNGTVLDLNALSFSAGGDVAPDSTRYRMMASRLGGVISLAQRYRLKICMRTEERLPAELHESLPSRGWGQPRPQGVVREVPGRTSKIFQISFSTASTNEQSMKLWKHRLEGAMNWFQASMTRRKLSCSHLKKL